MTGETSADRSRPSLPRPSWSAPRHRGGGGMNVAINQTRAHRGFDRCARVFSFAFASTPFRPLGSGSCPCPSPQPCGDGGPQVDTAAQDIRGWLSPLTATVAVQYGLGGMKTLLQTDRNIKILQSAKTGITFERRAGPGGVEGPPGSRLERGRAKRTPVATQRVHMVLPPGGTCIFLDPLRHGLSGGERVVPRSSFEVGCGDCGASVWSDSLRTCAPAVYRPGTPAFAVRR